MANKRDMYEVKTINGNGGPTGDRQHKKLIREGWELVNDKGGFLMTGRTRTYRRLNPNYVDPSAPREVPEMSAKDQAIYAQVEREMAEKAAARAARKAEKQDARATARAEKKAAKEARKAAK